MDPLSPVRTRKSGPEAMIQDKLMKKLKSFDWLVIATYGNEYQMGFPDLYCAHLKYATRWIEVKNPTAYSFTKAQMEVFPALSSKGVGIWILTSDSDEEIRKLFKPANWYQYLSIMKG